MSEAPSQAVAPAPSPTALGLAQLVAMLGNYPVRSDGKAAPANFTLGMIQSFAGLMPAFGAPYALGQLVSVAMAQQLFTVFGPAFGGNATTNFALPNLNGITPIGGPPGQEGPGTLGMTWAIATQPGGPVPVPGMIAQFGGSYAPEGWLVADGSLLPIASFLALFSMIGTIYGGDGKANFALPNLVGATPVGISSSSGRPPVALGDKVPGAIPGLGLAWIICVTDGIYPSPDGGGGFPANEPFIGQVIAYAGPVVPQGWALCNGALLAIGDYTVLYSIIGNTYGGDGATDFALPNLSGLMIQGTQG